MNNNNTARAGSQIGVESVLSLLLRVRRNSRGWIAECPAHDDGGPSLSVGTGRDGRVLLRCFAGCPFEAIVKALGLEPRDLFALRREPAAARILRRPSATEIRAEIAREAFRFRAERGLSDSDRLLSHEVNTIRRGVSARLGIALEPVAASVFDGPYAGHERDALWPLTLEHAYADAWIRCLGEPPWIPIEDATESRIASLIFLEAQDNAALEMRRIYRAARGARRVG